jgi:hypothetical protein
VASKLLLDGQQRLTSLSTILRAEPLRLQNRVRPVEIAFNLAHPDRHPSEVLEVDEEGLDGDLDQPESQNGQDLRSVQERVQNRTFIVSWRALLADPHWVKVSDIFDSGKTDWQLIKPLGISPDDDLFDLYTKRLQQVRRIRDYQYVMQVIERDRSYEEVAEIFVRVNSLGMKLRGSDLAMAQITAKWQNSLQLFEDFAEECERVWFTFDVGLLVRALVIFATQQSRFRTVGGIDVATLKQSWEKAKQGLRFAVNFLRTNAGIEDESLLASPFLVLPVAVSAVLKRERLTPADERELLHWLFVANATGHYSRGSSETILDNDLNLLFRQDGDPRGLVGLVEHRAGRIRFTAADFAGRSSRNPLFPMVFLALRHAGAKDWRTGLGLSLSHSGRSHTVEAHHIFPKAAMKDHDQTEVNEIANLAFVAGTPNRSIGSNTPDVYLPSIVEKRGLEALTSQCIPTSPDLWKKESFREFLEYRRAALARAVNDFLDQVVAEGTGAALDVTGLIEAGESESVEFKETARYNVHTKQPDKVIESLVVRAVAGFFNARGGTLLIGVNDYGVATGVRRDFKTLGDRPNADGFEQFLRSLLNTNLGKDRCAQVQVEFASVEEDKVAVVRVPASDRPVYVRDGKSVAFYVRSGNTTQTLDTEQAHNYISAHFG